MSIRIHGDAAHDAESTDWAMFSPEGNAAVAEAVAKLRIMLIHPGTTTPDFAQAIQAELRKIISAGHGEVMDTMVRETIFAALEGDVVRVQGTDTALQVGLVG